MTEEEVFIADIVDYVSGWQDVPGDNLREDLKDHLAGLFEKLMDERFAFFIEEYYANNIVVVDVEKELAKFKESYAEYKKLTHDNSI